MFHIQIFLLIIYYLPASFAGLSSVTSRLGRFRRSNFTAPPTCRVSLYVPHSSFSFDYILLAGVVRRALISYVAVGSVQAVKLHGTADLPGFTVFKTAVV